MQQISLIHDLLLAFMQSKNGFVGLQHVPGWTEIYSVVMSKKRALAFLIPLCLYSCTGFTVEKQVLRISVTASSIYSCTHASHMCYKHPNCLKQVTKGALAES
jgi:hypothetical protein